MLWWWYNLKFLSWPITIIKKHQQQNTHTHTKSSHNKSNSSFICIIFFQDGRPWGGDIHQVLPGHADFSHTKVTEISGRFAFCAGIHISVGLVSNSCLFWEINNPWHQWLHVKVVQLQCIFNGVTIHAKNNAHVHAFLCLGSSWFYPWPIGSLDWHWSNLTTADIILAHWKDVCVWSFVSNFASWWYVCVEGASGDCLQPVTSGDVFTSSLCMKHIVPKMRSVNIFWAETKFSISQTTFSQAFSWMKMYEIWLRFHWSLFLRVQLTIFQYFFR